MCEEAPYGPKSDIWAFGCLLYELLAGEPPFTAANQVRAPHSHLSYRPRARPHLPPTLLKTRSSQTESSTLCPHNNPRPLTPAVVCCSPRASPEGGTRAQDRGRRAEAPPCGRVGRASAARVANARQAAGEARSTACSLAGHGHGHAYFGKECSVCDCGCELRLSVCVLFKCSKYTEYSHTLLNSRFRCPSFVHSGGHRPRISSA